MNANQMINMIFRMVFRKAVNRGINAGMNKVAGGPAKGQRQPGGQNNARKARQAMKMARRAGRL